VLLLLLLLLATTLLLLLGWRMGWARSLAWRQQQRLRQHWLR
jgi:hypothetical protein